MHNGIINIKRIVIMRKNFLLKTLLLGFIMGVFSCGTKNSEEKSKLIIFHAGSLSVPFQEIAEAFMKENPNIEVVMESAGSRQCARKITDLEKECDIMASADYKVIDNLLIPEHADWNIKFASNEMALVFHEQSRYSDEITIENWYKILLKEDVAFGRSEPNSDPCGYRAVLTSKLAEQFYNKNGLSKEILAKNTNYIRPKETDLLSLLETNTIDYIFLYRSVAQQHSLKYLILPDSINLKLPSLKTHYNIAETEISGKKPGEFITKKGAPMVYGITIPTNAPNYELAVKFVQYVLEKNKGMRIMEENGQPSLVPSFSETFKEIPEALKKFAKE